MFTVALCVIVTLLTSGFPHPFFWSRRRKKIAWMQTDWRAVIWCGKELRWYDVWVDLYWDWTLNTDWMFLLAPLKPPSAHVIPPFVFVYYVQRGLTTVVWDWDVPQGDGGSDRNSGKALRLGMMAWFTVQEVVRIIFVPLWILSCITFWYLWGKKSNAIS